MKKSCPGQEAHPFSRVKFTERLYEKKVDPSARFKSLLCNNNIARACSDRLSLTELTRLGEPKCLYGEKLTPLPDSRACFAITTLLAHALIVSP